MPTLSTAQTQMDTMLGKYPCLDANGVIDNISYKRNVVAKTAAYTVLASQSGTLFTNYGATASVTFTLPAMADGLEFWFFAAADVALVVASGTADKIVTSNDAAADSVAFQTSSEILGNAMVFISDGTLWYCLMLATNAGSLPYSATIAT